ncbi:MAG: cation:proton antiporter [Bryobacterales bacterium]|nr:cation:proton antiporter [Bryobacterales bacterium]MEB2362930.1 cation:proton antiporter [Bryobacterales bacterium]
MQLVLLLIVIGLMHAARSFSPQSGLGAGPAGTTMAGGFLLLSALFAGNLSARLRMPQLTGYMIVGILVGPHVLALVTDQMLVQLRVFNGVAIALIALTAGVEMDFQVMRPLMRGIAWVTGIAVVGTMVVLSATAYLLKDLMPFMYGMSTVQLLAVSLVLGVTLSAQSPAVVVALRKELDADGPLTRTVLGVVVLSDLVIVVLFALVSSLARSLLGGSAADSITTGVLAWEIFGSALAGVFIGLLVTTYLRSIEGGGALFVITLGFLVAEVGQRIHLDPLLVALFAGMFIRNLTSHGDRLHKEIEAASLPVYIGFFAVAGATIHLDALMTVGIPAVVLVLVRGISFVAGGNAAARVAASAEAVRKFTGFGLLSQAGLALVLAVLFSRSFPQLGAGASALVFGVVALNQIFAPILYRWALIRSGEARADSKAPPVRVSAGRLVAENP